MNNELLALLADGEVHSGQELADVLGVSRTAVWKQLGKLAHLGLEVASLKGQGYRLAAPLQLLDAGYIERALSPSAAPLLAHLDVHQSLDSTNTLALERANRGSQHGAVIVAEHQSAGRGRRGRDWVSPFASNLYLSLTWEFTGGAASLEGLSLAVGVALAEALKEIGIENCRLKWPNDILVDGDKLGGVLLEMTGDAAGLCAVVIGIGVNVQMPEGAGRTIDQDWTDIRSLPGGADLHRNDILVALLNHLLPAMRLFSDTGFSAFRPRWTALDATADCAVELVLGNRRLPGTARGVDNSGALRLETSEGIESFHGGEVSLRGLA